MPSFSVCKVNVANATAGKSRASEQVKTVTMAEFDRIETIVATGLNKGEVATNAHYIEVAEQLIAINKRKLDELVGPAEPVATVEPTAPEPTTPVEPVVEPTPEPVAEKPVALSEQATIDAVESARSEADYTTAIDDMVGLYFDSKAETPLLAQYLEDNAKDKAFTRAWNEAEQRNNAAAEKPGENGIGMGTSAKATTSVVSKSTVDALSAAFGKFSGPGKAGSKAKPSKQALLKLVALVQAKARFALPISVVANPAEAGVTFEGEGAPMGVFTNGRIYLFTDGINSMVEAQLVLFHEMFHYGLAKSLTPQAYRELMTQLGSDPTVAKYAAQWKESTEGKKRAQRMDLVELNDLAVEEALAAVVEDLHKGNSMGTSRGLVTRTIAKWVAKMLDAVGMVDLAQSVREMTLTQAEKFVTGVMRDVMGNGGNPLKPVLLKRGAKFSAGSTTGDIDPDAIPDAVLSKGLRGTLNSILDMSLPAKPWVLNFFTTEQIAEMFKKVPKVREFSAAMNAMAARTSELMGKSDKLKREWSNLKSAHGEATDKRFGQLLIDSTMLKIWPTKELSEQKHLDIDNEQVQRDYQKTKSAFAALPKGYQALYTKLADDFRSNREAKIAALRKNVVGSFYPEDGATGGLTREQIDDAGALDKDERVAYFKEHATNKQRRDTLKSLWADLNQMENTFSGKLAGPYFPLMRFGNHIVTYKSPKLVAAQEALAAATQKLQGLYAQDSYGAIAEAQDTLKLATRKLAKLTDPTKRAEAKAAIEKTKAELDKLNAPVDAAKAQVDAARNAVNTLKASKKDYGVRFFEGIGDAKEDERRLKEAFGANAVVERGTKDEYFQQLDGVSHAFIDRLTSRVSSQVPEAQVTKMRQTMRALVYEMAPDTSALKSQLERKDVAGVLAEQAMRSFATAAMRDAWAIGRMEHKDAATDALNAMRFNREDPDGKAVGANLAQRLAKNMVYEDHPILDGLAGLTYMTYLGLSPSFIMTNMTQPWFISAPIMAARHGMGSISTLGSATKVAMQMLKVSHAAGEPGKGGFKTLNFAIDIQRSVDAKVITAAEGAFLQKMADAGAIDITIRHDLGAAAHGAEDGGVANWLTKAAGMASVPAQQIEVVNRVGTALAAYRMELAKTGSADGALDYAKRIVSETHLNYAAENRASFMHPNSWGGWGRIMFQFRSYQQGMLYLVGKNLVMGIKGDKEARRATAYLAGTMFASGGLRALPGAAAMGAVAQMIYAMFTDDDDEKDLQQMFVAGLRESGWSDDSVRLITKGAPAAFLNVDISGRTGMGNIASLVPYSDDSKHGREMAAAYYFAATGGAAGSMVANWMEAIYQADKGEYAKASTFVLPKVLADLVRADRMSTDGLVNSSGNAYLRKEDVTTWDTAVRAMGLDTAHMSDVKDERGALFEAKANIKDVRNTLLSKAARGKDVAEDIAGFNARHPQSKITTESLNNVRRIARGGAYSKADKVLADELGLVTVTR